MASIAKEKNGTRRILFAAPEGSRKTIRLGKVSQRTAEGVKYRVEQLLEALNFNRSMEADLVQWVTDLTAHEKTPVLPGLASSCDYTRLPEIAGAGFEPTTSRL